MATSCSSYFLNYLKFKWKNQTLLVNWAIILLREAFQSKKQPNLGISQNRGGVVKKSKKSQVSVGKSSKLRGLRKSKKSQVSEGTKD